MITNREVATPDRGRLWLVAGTLFVLLAVVWWPGCRKYPAVTSKESLGLVKLLYAACNTRDEKRLARAEERLTKLVQEGALSEPEREAFAEIVSTARAGQWERAEKAAFRFAQDQIGQGSESTRVHESHDHPHDPKAGKAKGK